MAEDKPTVGAITWTDLTVENADQLRDFYQEVVGWATTDVDMDGYNDYCMNTPGGGLTVAGICHARGANAVLPPQWLLYITVEDLDASIERCRALDGEVVAGPGALGDGRFCVIRDPAGAVAALYQP